MAKLGTLVLSLTICVLALCGLDAWGKASSSSTNPPAATSELARLTAELIAMGTVTPKPDPATADLKSKLYQTASARRKLLVAYLPHDPSGFFKHVMPATPLQKMPATVHSLLESYVQLDGTIEVLLPHGSIPALYHLVVGKERFDVHFVSPPLNLLTGSLVRIRGVRLDHHLVVAPD